MDDSLENQLIGSPSITNQVFLSGSSGGGGVRQKGRREEERDKKEVSLPPLSPFVYFLLLFPRNV